MKFTYGEFGRDYRGVMQKVIALHAKKPDEKVWVTADHGSWEYKVFRLKQWEQDVDSDLQIIEVSSRAMKDSTVFYLNIARDLMMNLRIRAKGERAYLVEARPGAQRLVAARLGVAVADYGNILLKGGLGKLLLKDVEYWRDRYRRLRRTVRNGRDVNVENRQKLEEERNYRLSEILRELSVTSDNLFVSRNQLTEVEKELQILRNFIINNGLTPPDTRHRPPWNPG